MKKEIYPALWFDDKAKEALEFYTTLFSGSEILDVTPVVVSANIGGLHFIGINGGPLYLPNPSISFMVVCETIEEVNNLYSKITAAGNVLMPLKSYPFSKRYAWVSDQYGVNWQIYLGNIDQVNHQKIIPTLMFGYSQQGNCQNALSFYQSIFKNFELRAVQRYSEGAIQNQIMHAQFIINDFIFGAMDSAVSQDFTFNEGVSFVIECENQDEIDYYWETFTHDGTESQCGWCKDQFGVSWQIVPKNLNIVLAENPNASAALQQMKKLVISELQNAQ
ncbi:VOC family protein [Sphingobacterium alkalisoli]|nr:VOC family protein [Sphingobacterium alkalisoli]